MFLPSPRIQFACIMSVGLPAAQLSTGPAQAQAIRAVKPPHNHRIWLKAGLRLSHFTYAYAQRGTQFVLPISVGAEYRLTSQFSLYGLAEADIVAGRGRRRGAAPAMGNVLSAGLRYYYCHTTTPDSLRTRPVFSDYLALEGNADFAGTIGRRGRSATLNFTPALYALWGTQHRWDTHPLLFDFNAGLGLLVMPDYGSDRTTAHHLDVAVQVNMRLYFRR